MNDNPLVVTECPICYKKTKELIPCMFCAYSICALCINTMYFFDKQAYPVCPICKCVGAYINFKTDLDLVHEYIKRNEIERVRESIRVRRQQEEAAEERLRNYNGCCCIS